MKTLTNIILLIFCSSLLSCNKDFEIKLPPDENKIVIECYLIPGEPYRAKISQSQDLLTPPNNGLDKISATVVIIHNNRRDTLKEGNFIDPIQKQTYNYGSNIIAVADKLEYTIEVTDLQGRKAYGTTKFIDVVPYNSITPIFNKEKKAYCLSKFNDDPNKTNYYRLTLNKNSPVDSLEMEAIIDDNFANNNNEIIYGSGYDFVAKDKVYATLYHLTPEYYKYLTTLQNARAALINPFAVSGEIVYNVKGGFGVFAALTYTRKMVVIPSI